METTSREVMAKEVSTLNTYWLLQYLGEHHPEIDQEKILQRIAETFPCYIRNLKNGKIEQLRLEHLLSPRYWLSHQFLKTLHDLIQDQLPDPRLGFKIGSSLYKTQPMIRTALGIPLLGMARLPHRVAKEATKYNRTKQYHVQLMEKGHIAIRVIHNPGIVIGEFAIQWSGGCFFSYARLAGATEISVEMVCVDPGPESPDDSAKAIWDFQIRYKEPGLFTRLAKAMVFKLPWVKELREQAEAIEEEHHEQILDRDNIINERTAALQEANRTMRSEINVRKQAEEALLQSQGILQRYITAIDDIGLGLCVIDADYRVRRMNRTMVDWFGEHHGRSCHLTIMGRKEPCTHCNLPDVIEQAQKVRYQPTMDDGRNFEIVATPITNNDGTISKMVMIRDISEQQQQEQRRLEISLQHEQLKKMASLKTMAGAIAHRFNNAMVGVQGNLELLALTLPDRSKEQKMAANAFQAAKGASQIGSMMLSYVGQRPLSLHKESLVEIVGDILSSSSHIFHPKINLKIVPPSHPLYCSIDRQQIREVIENILINAVESLENGSGTVNICFGKDHFTTADFPLFFQDTSPSNAMYAYCQIEDSGHGVNTEDLAKVFEPFYSTRFIGRGLGLAQSVGIIQAHHGAITFDSIEGAGTTVRILLPVITSPRHRTANVHDEQKVKARLSMGNILLVDDEAIVLKVSKEIIKRLGFSVDTAINGREAVDKISRRDEHYCAVVMDISMPEMDGIEAMQYIRDITPDLPILLCSGYSESHFIFNEDQNSKPDGFLGKPFNIADLKGKLEVILSKS